ncbi:MAG: hypothetical protein ACXVCP_19570 [Bdellovibrio sp.]
MTVDSLQSAMLDGSIIPLSPFLPKSVRGLNNTTPVDCRANCFGTAVAWETDNRKMDKTSTLYRDADAMWAYVEGFNFEGDAKLNKFEIISRDLIRFGDLMVVYSVDTDGNPMMIHHAARVVNHEFLWHKPTKENIDPFTFNKIDDEINYYSSKTGKLKKSIMFLRRP